MKWAGVMRLGGVGDNIIASSLFPLLKAEGYMVDVLCFAPYHVIFQNNPHVDKITVLKPEQIPKGNVEAQRWYLSRGADYDRWINLNHSVEVSLALNPGQTEFYWSAEMRRNRCGVSYLEHTHNIAGLPHEFAPAFYPTDEELEGVERTRKVVGERFIGWCISGTRNDKMYPHSATAVARLIVELDAPVVMFGAPGKDFEIATAIRNHVERQNGTVKNLHLALSPDANMPTWPIRRVLATCQAASLMIGPDTGPMWACAMTDKPKLMIHGHASPENITKHWKRTTSLLPDWKTVRCWPCHQLHDDPSTCTPNKDGKAPACISSISVSELVAASAKLWRGDDERDFGLCREGDVGLGIGRGDADPAFGVGRGTGDSGSDR